MPGSILEAAAAGGASVRGGGGADAQGGGGPVATQPSPAPDAAPGRPGSGAGAGVGVTVPAIGGVRADGGAVLQKQTQGERRRAVCGGAVSALGVAFGQGGRAQGQERVLHRRRAPGLGARVRSGTCRRPGLPGLGRLVVPVQLALAVDAVARAKVAGGAGNAHGGGEGAGGAQSPGGARQVSAAHGGLRAGGVPRVPRGSSLYAG
mmetsp:Transcript_26599/g.50273  ORF Transcript_26599/g.50273 Transcript_26599/m.50273 type:complete len:206 (+) Transcript_26599:51-668(+)